MSPKKQFLTINEIAVLIGVGRERVDALIEAGEIKGAFTIPSAGRYGRIVKVPVKSVQEAIARWGMEAHDSGENASCLAKARP